MLLNCFSNVIENFIVEHAEFCKLLRIFYPLFDTYRSLLSWTYCIRKVVI